MTGRPDPETLLARVRAAEAKAGRGRLKIFFGASPGVGKTYAMLEEARAKRREGMDVVVGIVETHGRAETAQLLDGLDVLPRRRVEYRGVSLTEFDLDAALARHPTLILVDELAHTNAPGGGSRHTRRFQDVEELLAAGINVATTLNVQHLESLNDVVAQITGIQVRETVPDSILDEADELELADLSAEDLLTRLREGKVYVPEQATRAVDQFFRKGNLIALRELALRRTAQRVDAQMRGYMEEHGIRKTWAAGERLLVCIGPNPAGARLVRAGKQMATSLKCDWIVLYIEAPGQRISADDRQALVANLQLAEELGAQTVTVAGLNPAEEVLAYARAHNATKIVVGKPTHSRWRDTIFGSVLDQLVRGSGDLDVYVITGEAEQGEEPRRAPVPGRPTPFAEYVRAAGIIGLATLVAFPVFSALSVTDVSMVFLLAVALVASRYGRMPTLVASLLCILSFDFFFVPPRFTLAVSDVRYLLTFAVMLAIALLISGLTLRIRAQAETARGRERRTAALYAMSRELAAARAQSELISVASRHIAVSFGAQVQVLLPHAGRVEVPVGAAPAFPIDEKERSVAQWVFDRSQPAGVGTETLPAAHAMYLPLAAAGGTVGVLGVRPLDPAALDDPTTRQLLEAFAAQTALALERAQLAARAQQEQVEVEAERLRTSLLSSLSHDLRTPLGTITGAASTLLQEPATTSAESRRGLLQAILDESQRMNRLIGNLLDMIRVESGALQVQKEWQPLEEPVGVALIRLEDRLRDHPVTVRLPPDLLVPVDGVLIEQVFLNLLENAVKYTPPGTPVEIIASVAGGVVRVDVADRGPGLPPGEETKVFDKFYRAAGAPPGGGVGLGLTICRGIITAHGGRIWAENRPEGGSVFRFTIPLEGPPLAAAPADDATVAA